MINEQTMKKKTTNIGTYDEMHMNSESINKKTYSKYQLMKDMLMMRHTWRDIVESKLKPNRKQRRIQILLPNLNCIKL